MTAVLVVLVTVRLSVFRNCSETVSRFLTERAHAAWLRALPPSRKAIILARARITHRVVAKITLGIIMWTPSSPSTTSLIWRSAASIRKAGSSSAALNSSNKSAPELWLSSP